MKIDSICVYCGSNFSTSENFREKSKELGVELVKRGIRLVYGGGKRGLMGLVASAVKENGGYAIGVTPKRFDKGKYKTIDLDEYYVVDTMHERKRKMYDKADAFIALPGGIGTIEEYSEMITWRQIGFSSKPIVLYNIDNFYSPFISQMEVMKNYGFLSDDAFSSIAIKDNLNEIFSYFDSYVEPEAPYKL